MGERQPKQWILDGVLYARIDEPPDWSDGWTAERLRSLSEVFGELPPRVVAVDISGRDRGWEQVRRLVLALLAIGRGAAMDDWSNHAWRAEEIDEGRDEQGQRFFEPDRP
jgi:tRNA U38,U39,U40 pseudouridine synthase TruA